MKRIVKLFTQPEKKGKFIIFGRGRSGSNLLRSLLNSHPDVFCDPEIFNEAYPKMKFFAFKWLITSLPFVYLYYKKSQIVMDYYGFKLHYYQFSNIKDKLRVLSKRNWKIIHLQRKNIIKEAFSWIIARQTEKWVRTSQQPDPTEKYHVNVEMFLERVAKSIQSEQAENEILDSVDHIKVIYEEELLNAEDWGATCAKIFKYIGTDPVPVSSNTRITDPRPDAERIENFQEIVNALNTAGYEELVDEYFNMLQ